MCFAQVFISIIAVSSAIQVLAVTLPAPRINSCGVKGYNTKTDAYFYDDSGKYAGHTKCYNQCQMDNSCQSFAYDEQKTCMLYDVVVYGNFEADDDSTHYFYDRGCISPSNSISTTTTAKPTSTSTTPVKSTTKSTTSSTTRIFTTSSTKKSTASSVTISSKSLSTSTSNTFTMTTTGIKSVTSSSSAVTVPSGCNIPSKYTITNFSWFNSTHNLDCATGPDIGDGTGCIGSDAQGNTYWCDPKTDKSCTNCGIAVCSTGLPPQPLGYGPPDDVKFTFNDGSACEQLNPAVVHRVEVGEGWVTCGGSYDFMNFYGSSNAASQTGRVEINGYPTQCADGQTIVAYYNTEFQIDCTHDAQRNATCTTPHAFTIPLISYSKSSSY